MATNLHALIRYRTINRCLKDINHDYNWEGLAIACAESLKDAGLSDQKTHEFVFSRRTIFNDIKNMKSGILGYFAPIEYDRSSKCFYYTESKFSIDHLPIKKEELEELNNSLLILKQFSGKSNLSGLENIITKLEETLNIRRGKKKEIIQFDHSLNEAGQKWVNIIYNAIKNQKAQTIVYQPFGKEKSTYIISPYLLKEYNNRWFVFGKPHNIANLEFTIINLAMDRIKSCKDSLREYEDNSLFNPDVYLKEIIGVSLPIDGFKQIITFKAFGTQSDYIETKPLHESQRILDKSSEFCLFSIEVIPNFELESRFLSFGEKVQVLSPLGLVEKIKNRIISINQLYLSTK